MKSFLSHDLVCLLFLTLAAPLFFYKLGQSSLNDWDEAWYSDISRTIAQTNDFLNMSWNGQPYFDHPYFGYWIQALTFKIFGVSEFWARFPQALSGLLCLYLVYLLGKELFNKVVGFVSAITLTSAFWFIERSRSGNLDILLTLLFLLTTYLAIKVSSNKKYFLPLAISLICLFLTKTLIPLVIIPTLVVIFWGKKINWIYLLTPAIIILAFFLYQFLSYPLFLKSFTSVGLRGVNLQTDYIAHLKLTKDYLYQGIGRWFWPGFLGILISLLLRQKRLLILLTFVLSFLFPFLFSPKVQIWHLIPIYPFWLLLFFGSIFSLFEKYTYSKRYLLLILTFIPALFVYKNQITRIWSLQIDTPAYISDIAILAKEASKYPYPLFTDGDFDPTAKFYSAKIVRKIPRSELGEIFSTEDTFLLITSNWRLDEAKIDPKNYQILKADRDKILILHL